MCPPGGRQYDAKMDPRFSDFGDAWFLFLQQFELLKHRHAVWLLKDHGPVPANPTVDEAISTLSVIKAVCLLDEALELYRDAEGIAYPPKSRQDLNARIALLAEAGRLRDSSELHRIRRLRNGLAHSSVTVSQRQAADILDALHCELESLGLVGPRPVFEFFAERSQMQQIDDPAILGRFEYTYGLRARGRVTTKVSWSENLYRAGNVDAKHRSGVGH